MWNGLEVAKLLASILTPIAVLVAGITISRGIEDYKSVQQQRLAVYETIKDDLNLMFIHSAGVGDQNKIDCPELIKRKHAVDKVIYLSLPFLTESIYSAHEAFELLIFNGSAPNASIRDSWDKYLALLNAFRCGVQENCTPIALDLPKLLRDKADAPAALCPM